MGDQNAEASCEQPGAAVPCFLPARHTETVPRITQATFLRILDGEFGHEDADQKIIIDCRFKYEYDGGHVAGAVSIASFGGFADHASLDVWLFARAPLRRVIILLYCEFSLYRAPLWAGRIRSRDRKHNMERYPRLVYPDVYVVDGGYSSFFRDHVHRCIPSKYVKMSDTVHRETCEREMDRLKRDARGSGRP